MTHILILNFNGAIDTIECLQSIFNMKNRALGIVLVDNSSTDDSVHTIESWLDLNSMPFSQIGYFSQNDSFSNIFLAKESKITFIKSDINNGYASGNNIGLKYIMQHSLPSDFVWILNNDTIVETQTLDELIKSFKTLREQNIALLGSKVLEYEYPHNIQSAGVKIGSIFKEEKPYYAQNRNALSSDIEVDSICGCSVFLNLETLDEIGLMREEYFLYYEETDWMRSVKLKGFRIFTCANSIILHKHARSTGGYLSPMVLYYMTRNRVLFNKKYLSGNSFLLFSMLFSLFTLSKAVIYFFRNRLLSYSILSGMIDGFNGVTGKTYQSKISK
jgi:GT2 family glycosyltransferase